MPLPFPPSIGDWSPWGPVQSVVPLGADACEVGTASHGGILVTPAALGRIPEPLRETAFSRGGWFEEDCDWCIPYLSLALDDFERDPLRGATNRTAARRTLERFHPAHVALIEAPIHPEDER